MDTFETYWKIWWRLRGRTHERLLKCWATYSAQGRTNNVLLSHYERPESFLNCRKL